MKNLTDLPDDLPAPIDDGACNHLAGSVIPSLSLPSTAGAIVDLSTMQGTLVVYFYPAIGRPDSRPLTGWNAIPGARGCTPQSCAFRDHKADLERLGAAVFGVSAQPLEDQREAVGRLNLPFELLNDSKLGLARAMGLPTFEYESSTFIKRLTIIAIEGEIRKVFYPVFPPDQNADAVIDWLRTHKG